MPQCVRRVVGAVVLLVMTAGLPALAEEEGPPSVGEGTYVAEELQALDRALHAANMTREDLTFRKDMTRGHACLERVRAMLHDPLEIAPSMDELAGEVLGGDRPFDAVTRALAEAAAWIGPDEEVFFLPLAATLGDLDDVPGSVERDLLHWENWENLLALRSPEGERVGGQALRALRHALPASMAWHDVFDAPYPDEAQALDAFLEQQDDAWLHEVLATLDVQDLAQSWWGSAGRAWWHAIPVEVFPKDAPLIVETPHGRIGLGTTNDDVYEGEFAFLVDPGGNDRYESCRIGAAYGTEKRRVGLFADYAGDDVYDCGDVDITLGAAVLGLAAFYDFGQGNDRYAGGHGSLGAAMGGIATFYDDGGTDVYEGKTFTQGAAGFGVAVFFDDSTQARPETSSDEGTKEPVEIALFDNDRLSAWSNAQAFARCRGVALCVNRRGNEVYQAGGVYLHAPLFADRYQSFSQGFAIGARNIDYAGGIAMLIDGDGNDRYLGDIYDQGVGYWYGAGFLWDGGGNDTYEMTQYGQGSGIHLAVGGLVDVGGHDTYVMHSGLGQGGSHDYAASILHDRGGNDRYLGNTSCNGAALTNSVGLHIDRSGDDLYAGRRSGSINFGRPARGFGSIGVLLDLAGKDDYLGIMEDDTQWRHTQIGVGLDRQPPEAEPGREGVTPAADQPTGTAEIPAICAYEGELTAEVFDELWEIAVRWEVGDNRVIVPKARERLIAFGIEVLPRMYERVEIGASGLELRAFVEILEGLRAAGHDHGVEAFVAWNLASGSERRRRVGLYLTHQLKVESLEADVASILAGDDEALARRAAGVLRALGSHAGDATLLTWLDPRGDERNLQAALDVLLGLGADVYEQVRPLLDHPLLSVRTRLVELLVGQAATYLDALRADLMAGDVSERARRTILEVLVRTVPAPDPAEVLALTVLLEHPDWGMRADAVRLVRRWQADPVIEDEDITRVLERLATMREEESDPYVRFCIEAD